LLAPQRGLTAIAKSKPKTEKTTNGRLPELQQFPLIAFQHFPLMSMGQFDHRFWFNASQMVIKRGAMSV